MLTLCHFQFFTALSLFSTLSTMQWIPIFNWDISFIKVYGVLFRCSPFFSAVYQSPSLRSCTCCQKTMRDSLSQWFPNFCFLIYGIRFFLFPHEITEKMLTIKWPLKRWINNCVFLSAWHCQGPGGDYSLQQGWGLCHPGAWICQEETAATLMNAYSRYYSTEMIHGFKFSVTMTDFSLWIS